MLLHLLQAAEWLQLFRLLIVFTKIIIIIIIILYYYYIIIFMCCLSHAGLKLAVASIQKRSML